MEVRSIIPRLKNRMLPIAMVVGALFHDFFASLAFLTPYLIFVMLVVPYCTLSSHRIRIGTLHYLLLAVQIVGALAVYAVLSRFDTVTAEGVFICVLVPTAVSSAVITGMLGGSVTMTATFCLVSNFCVALLSPVLFSFIGEHGSVPFIRSFGLIGRQVLPLLIFPFLIAVALKRYAPRWHRKIRDNQQAAFYLWAVSLTIVMGSTVSFILKQEVENFRRESWIAGLSLAVCALQFLIGRGLGRKYGDRVAGAQGLGQKNTVLAIWMAHTYLNPVASIGPASYVIWQNLINSWQLGHKRRRDQKKARAVPAKRP